MKESFDKITNLFNTQKETSYLYTITTFNMLPLFNVGDNVVLTSSDYYYPNDIVLFKSNNKYLLGRIKYIKDDNFGIWLDSSIGVFYPVTLNQIAGKVKCYRKKSDSSVLYDFNSKQYKVYMLFWNNLLFRYFCLLFLKRKINRLKEEQRNVVTQKKKRKRLEDKYPE